LTPSAPIGWQAREAALLRAAQQICAQLQGERHASAVAQISSAISAPPSALTSAAPSLPAAAPPLARPPASAEAATASTRLEEAVAMMLRRANPQHTPPGPPPAPLQPPVRPSPPEPREPSVNSPRLEEAAAVLLRRLQPQLAKAGADAAQQLSRRPLSPRPQPSSAQPQASAVINQLLSKQSATAPPEGRADGSGATTSSHCTAPSGSLATSVEKLAALLQPHVTPPGPEPWSEAMLLV
jgi:hypothetical protein